MTNIHDTTSSATEPLQIKRQVNNWDINNFIYMLPLSSRCMCLPSRETWPNRCVDIELRHLWLVNKETGRRITPTSWLAKHRKAASITWAPGEPTPLVLDRVAVESGWINYPGMNTYNSYVPPKIKPGDPHAAGPWVDHVRRVYPDDADHIIKWLAQRVQQPGVKINHGLVLGGAPGIGKDTILEPVVEAVGYWNVEEVSPSQLMGRFNGFLKSVILRVSEARNLGDSNRFALYEHTKVLLASPPATLRCDEKYLREHYVFNVTGVVFTTNRKDALYLPEDDRRHYVAWSRLEQDDYEEEYFNDLYRWYRNGGNEHVAAYLHAVDLSDFNPKWSPPKTPTFWEIVAMNRPMEDSEFLDALDALGMPDAVTLDMVKDKASRFGLRDWLDDRRNARAIPHRMRSCGYAMVHRTGTKDGYWHVGGRRLTVYARKELSADAAQAAAAALAAAPKS